MRTSRHPASTQTTFPTWRPCSSLSLEWSTYVEISSPNNPWTYLNTLFSLRRLSAVPSLILRYLVCQSCRLWKRCQRWEALAAERPAKLCPIHAQCQRKSCTFEAMTWHSWAAHAHCQMWICLKIRYLRFLWSTLSLYIWIYIYDLLSALASLFGPFCFLVFGPRNYLQISRNYLQSSRNYLKKHALYWGELAREIWWWVSTG